MSKIKIKKGLVVAHGDNTVTIVKNDPIKKTVSIEILNAITGETLPANLTHAENDSIQFIHLESGKTQNLTKEFFKHLVDNNHVKIV